MTTDYTEYKTRNVLFHDADGNDIDPNAMDMTKGRFIAKEDLVEHVKAQEHVDAQGHYEFETIYFTDGTTYEVQGTDDPNIGDEGWIGDSTKHQLGADQVFVVDEEEVEGHGAYELVDIIETWTPYTADELAERARGTQIDRIRALESEFDSIAETMVKIDDTLEVMAEEIAEIQAQLPTADPDPNTPLPTD